MPPDRDGTADGLPGIPTSLWHDRERRAFAPLEGDVDVDVVVVGGGITGLTTALLMQEAGVRVAVVERHRVGGGTTGNSTGKVTSQHTLTYAELEDRLGADAARHYGAANEDAVRTVEALAGRYGIDASVERRPAFAFAGTEEQRRAVQDEAEAAARAGLPAAFVEETELPLPIHGAVRFDDQLQIDPSRYVVGLADAIVAGGGLVHEATGATDVDSDANGVTVTTDRGRVRGERVVVATLLPMVDRGFEFTKAHPSRSYGIAAELDGPSLHGMYISAGSPTRSLRSAPYDGGDLLVVVGESHDTGEHSDTERHYRALAGFAVDHFPVRRLTHRWSAQDYQPVDGLPYVGAVSRTDDRVLIATGFRKWGLSLGTAAARILTDAVEGIPNEHADVFAAKRLEVRGAVSAWLKENLEVGTRFLLDRVTALTRDIDDVTPGSGAVVAVDGRPCAVARDDDGRITALSPVCTHLGCYVTWNQAERSWDCPCHGSRFATDGGVLAGPATEPLERLDIEG